LFEVVFNLHNFLLHFLNFGVFLQTFLVFNLCKGFL